MTTNYAQPYDRLFDRLRSEFSNRVPASALVWERLGFTNQYGVRVECPFLGREFDNGVRLGRDPEGDLFFNNARDFTVRDGKDKLNVKCGVFPNGMSNDPKNAAFVIEWYNENSSVTFAKFLARDLSKDRVVKSPISTVGNWTRSATGSAYARLTREDSTSDSWELTIASIHRKINFKFLPQGANVNVHAEVDAQGLLMFKDINKLNGSMYMDYRDDRITFTPQFDGSHDFHALFLPIELEYDSEPLQGFKYTGPCTWSDYTGKD